MSDHTQSDDTSDTTDAQQTDNTQGPDETYKVKVGTEMVNFDDPIQTAQDIIERADAGDPEKTELVERGTEVTYRGDDEVDLSEPGVEQFTVQTRTRGNA